MNFTCGNCGQDYNLAARLAEVTKDRDAYFADLLDKNSRLAEAERLLFALRDGIAVADFGDWNLLDQVDSFRSGDSIGDVAKYRKDGVTDSASITVPEVQK